MARRRAGRRLLGRIRAIEAETLLLDDTVGACLRHGDAGSATLRRTADEAMLAAGLELPPAEDDPADQPHPDPEGVHSPPVLDLAREGVRVGIWATGVRGAFDWLPPGVLDADAAPVHKGGVMPMPGLFVLGLPWLDPAARPGSSTGSARTPPVPPLTSARTSAPGPPGA